MKSYPSRMRRIALATLRHQWDTDGVATAQETRLTRRRRGSVRASGDLQEDAEHSTRVEMDVEGWTMDSPVDFQAYPSPHLYLHRSGQSPKGRADVVRIASHLMSLITRWSCERAQPRSGLTWWSNLLSAAARLSRPMRRRPCTVGSQRNNMIAYGVQDAAARVQNVRQRLKSCRRGGRTHAHTTQTLVAEPVRPPPSIAMRPSRRVSACALVTTAWSPASRPVLLQK